MLGWGPNLWLVKGYSVNIKFSANVQPKEVINLETNEPDYMKPICDEYRLKI